MDSAKSAEPSRSIKSEKKPIEICRGISLFRRIGIPVEGTSAALPYWQLVSSMTTSDRLFCAAPSGIITFEFPVGADGESDSGGRGECSERAASGVSYAL